MLIIDSFHANSDSCCRLITIANSCDPDPDPVWFSDVIYERFFSKKKSADDKKHANIQRTIAYAFKTAV